MCTGEIMRFFCPEAITQNRLCPHYNPDGPTPVYRTSWVPSKFVCCGNHHGQCTQCPVLHLPGNVQTFDVYTVICYDCDARLKRGVEAEMEATADISEGESSHTDAGDESDEESDEESDVASDAADERADEEPYEEADQEADQEAGEEADEEASTEVDICDCANCRRSAAAETAEPCQPGFSITITVKFN
ncbi:hypothetical protein B0I37DRAFT_386976 [Chaetomium sp. MPI-CAGE-AT-0009]|nr:hypothetical protein B0I37DRAFT_386976 [Chaetomium sp. MPI-CAGE-AT-0009]